MGAAATLATNRLDMRHKNLNYELLVAHIKLLRTNTLQKVTREDCLTTNVGFITRRECIHVYMSHRATGNDG